MRARTRLRTGAAVVAVGGEIVMPKVNGLGLALYTLLRPKGR